ncbi:uncharacterized protein EV420DRAFT_1651861 [Desarmillaria tabescens]|uniref:Uncharacterized protein n=1 Tax=Armillaria tabescens TaxID=1929756 RepID=A0AA39MKU4_ARMTA|nr:uncharacterized protein EV420DRAFT_1651861 [Desarmillaria tabescens]KAK0437598.1 hypothetical protein EV420DRAFT_1651861 [Desarmillaria tabescens]
MVRIKRMLSVCVKFNPVQFDLASLSSRHKSKNPTRESVTGRYCSPTFISDSSLLPEGNYSITAKRYERLVQKSLVAGCQWYTMSSHEAFYTPTSDIALPKPPPLHTRRHLQSHGLKYDSLRALTLTPTPAGTALLIFHELERGSISFTIQTTLVPVGTVRTLGLRRSLSECLDVTCTSFPVALPFRHFEGFISTNLALETRSAHLLEPRSSLSALRVPSPTSPQ